MPAIDVALDGDNAWPDLADGLHDVLRGPEMWHLAALEGGMASGAVSLALRLDIDRGPGARVVVAETSLAAWIAATCVLRGRFPEAFRGTPLEGSKSS